MEILPVLLMPQAEALPIEPLRFGIQPEKTPLGARLHHVVKAIGHAVRQPRDKGVLLGQQGEDLPRVRVTGDTLGHLNGKFIGQSHDRQKLPLLFRQRIDHGGGEGGVDVGVAAGQYAALGERPQIQVHGGEPALAGIEEALHLCVGKLRAAAVGVDGKLCVVQAQLLRADLIDLGPQPHRLRRGQEAVAACNDQMDVCGQPVCQHTEEQGGALVRQQVEIVDKEMAGGLARQRVAEAVRQQPAARCVRGAGILPQETKAGAGKRLLHAFPEDRKVIGIHADADDMRCLRLGALAKIPVYRRGFSIAHGSHHRCHSAAGDRPQTLLQPLGYVDGVQIPFRLWHDAHLQRFSIPGAPAQAARRRLSTPLLCLMAAYVSQFA